MPDPLSLSQVDWAKVDRITMPDGGTVKILWESLPDKVLLLLPDSRKPERGGRICHEGGHMERDVFSTKDRC